VASSSVDAERLRAYLAEHGWEKLVDLDDGDVWGHPRSIDVGELFVPNSGVSAPALRPAAAMIGAAEHRPSRELQLWRDIRGNQDWIGLGSADLASVSPGVLETYLEATDWTCTLNTGVVSRWSRRPDEPEVLIPQRSLEREYPERLLDALRVIAAAENRPHPGEQVLAELTPADPTGPEPSAVADVEPSSVEPGESVEAAAAGPIERAEPPTDVADQADLPGLLPAVADQTPVPAPSPTPAQAPGQVHADNPATPAAVGAVAFRPESQDDLAPSGEVSRVRANLEAIRTLRAVQAEDRAATGAEQLVLARWSGWGAVARVFDERAERFSEARAELAELLDEQEVRAAARNTINAHYTDLELVGQIWRAVTALGFNGGRVLEPGCGSGNFLSLAPQGTQLVGVELEPTTAAIAQLLYPQATIRAESFADTRAPDSSFDLAIGNVPFADVRLADRVHNPGKHSIHNHFILKSLRLTKPGGLVAVLTSRYTMDARAPGARREMAELADLVGAVRLPSRAHRRAAGTDAVTDLLILRRREPGRAPHELAWEQARPLELDGGTDNRVNEYFLEHPQMVLGKFAAPASKGMYRGGELIVQHPNLQQLGTDFGHALQQIVAHAMQHDLRGAPVEAARAEPVALVDVDADRPEGFIRVVPDTGRFVQVQSGAEVAFAVPEKQRPELRALLRLRDTVVELLNAEAATREHSPRIDELRADLNRRYDAYQRRFGPINRFSWRRTGRTDPETGEDKQARIRPKLGGFRSDHFAATVFALENFDPSTQTATKADIFTQRVVAPREPRLEADSPADALALCLDTHGRLDLDEIARLLGTDSGEARQMLGTLVFDDPKTEQLQPAAEYLSGNVREKLAAAKQAAQRDSRFDANVAALTEVIPADLRPEEIHAALGAVWIGAEDVQQFLRETLQDGRVLVEHPGGSVWEVRGNKHGVQSTEVWGTQSMSAIDIAGHLLEQRAVLVYDSIPQPGGKPKRVLNPEKSAEAQAKAEELNERFGEWIWEDPARAERLAAIYNEQFNNLVLRSYDEVELSLPGLALTFNPRPHQVAAVARVISEPAVLLAHEVGAGKTAEMAMACMELRRLGLVKKPVIVVPNNMLEQFGREFAAIYPQAKLLLATKDDFAADRRRQFVARCATGQWDAVIMTKTAFERIPMSLTEQRAYLQGEVEDMRAVLEAAQSSENKLSVKRVEKMVQRAEERLKAKLDTDKDSGITFEATGMDYVVVDEAHLFKNLRTVSNISGAAIDGSSRASDLHMKLEYLREHVGQRVGTFATATPIANSITEAHVMLRYLRPDLLDDARVLPFDSWAATFGQQVTAIEVSPDGGRFRMMTRFAKFKNVPELVRMFHVMADVKTAEDLNLPVPLLMARPGDGQRVPEVVRVPASPEITDFVADLGHRADRIKQGRPREIIKVDGGVCDDSMLLVSGHGRNAALDLRLLPPSTLRHIDPPEPVAGAAEKLRRLWQAHTDPDTGRIVLPRESESDLWEEFWADTYGPRTTKLAAAADRIATRWRQHRDDIYPLPDGSEHPVRGSLQFVFSDLGTPNPEKWNAYYELRDLLVERGVPRGQIRFIHEANTDQAKAQLFDDARSGKIAVLMGSTEKMGVGTNAQTRAIALHHLDCPWRPADVQQREGRIIRQLNLNDEVEVLRYITEGSFDAYSWQTVARKATAIAQVMRGKLDVREIEDIGDSTMSYTEAKAIATGNPLLLDHASAQAELTKLQRLQRAHDRAQGRFDYTIRQLENRLPVLSAQRDFLATLVERRRDVSGDKFAITFDGRGYRKRVDAGDAVAAYVKPKLKELLDSNTRQRDLGKVGELGGIPLSLELIRKFTDEVLVRFQVGADTNPVIFDDSAFYVGRSNNVGLIRALENGLVRLEKSRAEVQDKIDELQREAEQAHDQLGKPFKDAEALAAAQTRLANIEKQLKARAAADEAPNTESADGTAGTHGAGAAPAPSHVSAGGTSPASWTAAATATGDAMTTAAAVQDIAGTAPEHMAATPADPEHPTGPAGPASSVAPMSAPVEPQAPTQRPDPPAAGRRRLTLRYTAEGGVVLLGTDKADRVGDLLKGQNHALGQWKWSRRIDNGTSEPGAWYIVRTRDAPADHRTVFRIANSLTTLQRAGHVVDVDIARQDITATGMAELPRHPEMEAAMQRRTTAHTDLERLEVDWVTDPDGTAERELSEAELRAYRSIPEEQRPVYVRARSVGADHNTGMGNAGRALARAQDSEPSTGTTADVGDQVQLAEEQTGRSGADSRAQACRERSTELLQRVTASAATRLPERPSSNATVVDTPGEQAHADLEP